MSDDHASELRFAVLASDVVLFTIDEGVLKVLLMEVNRPPHFPGVPGFPGGILKPDETAYDAAVRHLKEKGGVKASRVYLEQLYTFSKVDRDPRGRVVSVAYMGLMPGTEMQHKEDTGTWWENVSQVSDLAYDHTKILSTALERLRGKVTYTNLMAQLMPEEFTLTELQRAYEIVLDRELDKRNFRKKIQASGLIEATGNKRQGEHRPAELYTFVSHDLQEIELI